MLKSLSVAKFALIEDASVFFSQGLNIVTGETGAGKSILIDALNVVLGNRASTDYIRNGCDGFRVEAVFDISGYANVSTLLEEHGIDTEDDGTLIISRKYNLSGKNSILVNGCHVTLHILRRLGETLVDMHGQHENQTLLRSESYLSLVDSFDSGIGIKLEEYGKIYRLWKKTCTELNNMQSLARERLQRLDMLTWQTEEIAAAALEKNEDKDIEKKVQVLANAEKIATSANHAYALLGTGAKDSPAVTSLIADVKRDLELIVRYDAGIEQQLSVVTDALYQLEEVCFDLREYCDTIDFNPQQLAQFQNRLDLIYRLKKKYGTTIDEILEYYNNAIDEVKTINDYDNKLAAILSEKEQYEQQAILLADEIDVMRKEAARHMAKQICSHLVHLGMPKANLQIDVGSLSELNLHGRNEIQIFFSANPGEMPKPLQKVASGGELSRIALAIKTVCADRDEVGVLVFDEIDSGIGGKTAQMVAERIAMVASSKQVLCITHLPQIACMADSHIYIEKQIQNESTKTVIRLLNPSEQVVELTRMTGNDLTEVALENAKQMINNAKKKKEIWKNKA